MDFTTMVLITDLNTNFNTFFDLEEFNFYSLTGNEGTYITEEIELKMEIGQKCGITCIPENFSCKQEPKIIKNPIRNYKKVPKEDI